MDAGSNYRELKPDARVRVCVCMHVIDRGSKHRGKKERMNRFITLLRDLFSLTFQCYLLNGSRLLQKHSSLSA